MAMHKVDIHEASDAVIDVNGGKPVLIQHCRTEQQMVVMLADYQGQASTRFRNWRLSGHNDVCRPPTTVSEFLWVNGQGTPDITR